MPKKQDKKQLRRSLLQSHSRKSKTNSEVFTLNELQSIARGRNVKKVSSYSKLQLVDKILETLSDSEPSSSSVSDSTIAKLTTEIQQLTRKSKKALGQDGVEETKEPSPSGASRDRKSRAIKKIQKLFKKRRTQKMAATKLQTMTRKRHAMKQFRDKLAVAEEGQKQSKFQIVLYNLAGERINAYKNDEKPSLTDINKYFEVDFFKNYLEFKNDLVRVTPNKLDHRLKPKKPLDLSLIVRKVIENRDEIIERINNEQIDMTEFNRVSILKILEKDYDPDIVNDPEIVMEAFKRDEFILDDASEELLEHNEIMLAFIKENSEAFHSASQNLKEDRKFVMAAVKHDGSILEYISEEFQNDPEIVMEAVKQNSFALEFASEELRNNPEIVMMAVENTGQALYFASDEIKHNRDIVMKAIKQDKQALDSASETLRSDHDFMLKVIESTNADILHYASKNLLKDPNFKSTAIKRDKKARFFFDF